MRVNRIEYSGFRNLLDGALEPSNGVNVLYGNNAQGKTNLLEALWLFCGAKSFRGAREQELIQFGRQTAKLSLNFHAQEREQTAELRLGEGKKAILNGVVQSSAQAFSEKFHTVIFAPIHLALVRDGPSSRRRFLDFALYQLRPRYQKLITEYSRAIAQRNAALRDMRFHSGVEEFIDVLEVAAAKTGSRIARQRVLYVEALTPYLNEFFAGLSSGSEHLSLRYTGEQWNVENGGEQALIQSLRQSRKEDARLGTTSCGPHRDNLDIRINDREARIYGSQGQQRSAALAMKLAEASVMTEFSGEKPVALLDDVMSELDETRQDYILNRIGGWQVFITCCDPAPLLRMTAGRAFRIQAGVVGPACDAG